MRAKLLMAGGVLLLAGLPLVITDRFWLNLLVFIGIYSLLAISMTLVFGYAGQISFGHAGFFGIGAYTSAILTNRSGVPVLVGILAGALLTALVAYAIGLPNSRLRGYSLAMATLAFGEAMFVLFNELTSLTNGPIGMPGIKAVSFFGFTLDEPGRFYYLVWAVVLLIFLFARNLVDSRVGRALKAIAASERAAQVVGVHVVQYKVAIFAISGLLAGLAGGLYAHYVTFISSDLFNGHLSVMLVVLIAIGGMRSIWGALVGALLMTILPEFLRKFQDYAELFYGVILILIFMYAPGGVTGMIEAAWNHMRGRAATPAAAARGRWLRALGIGTGPDDSKALIESDRKAGSA